MDYCVSCGMPLALTGDFGGRVDEGSVCKFCVDSEGKVKSCEQVFEDAVAFFMNSVAEADKQLAQRLVRKNMVNQPLWRGKDSECLKGEVASDEEFKQALDKLQA